MPSSTTLRFRGRGLWTKVHSCLWNSHKTHSTAPSCITQRLLRLRQASQGLSLRVRMFATVPTVVDTGLPVTKFSLPGEGFCCLRGRAAAMGTGVGRGMAGCIATAVVISTIWLTGVDVWQGRDKGSKATGLTGASCASDLGLSVLGGCGYAVTSVRQKTGICVRAEVGQYAPVTGRAVGEGPDREIDRAYRVG